MKRFDSFLGPIMEEYLCYRENLGYCIEPTLNHLKVFDRYVKTKKRKAGKTTNLCFFFLDEV